MAAVWKQMDDWYWSDSAGSTICKVGTGDGYRYELWRVGAGIFVGPFKTLKAAQAAFEEPVVE